MGLKSIRQAAGLTLAELALKSGFGKSTIGNFENGKTDASPEFLKTMARVLAVSVEDVSGDQQATDSILHDVPAPARPAPKQKMLERVARIEADLQDLRDMIEKLT